MNLDHQLQNQLKNLRLGGVLETLDLRVQQPRKVPWDTWSSFKSCSRTKSKDGKPKSLPSVS